MIKRGSSVIFFVAIIALLGLTIYTGTAFADVRIGGKLETKIVGTLDTDDEFNSYIEEHLNLELILPDYGDTSGKMEFDIYHQPNRLSLGSDSQPTQIPISANISKMYIKQKFEHFNLTVGRQPISWSFGSILNPVDYSLSTEMTGMNIKNKSADGMEFYIPIDWKSGVTAVATYPLNKEGLKWGVRGRTTLMGYDMTMNYVSQPSQELPEDYFNFDDEIVKDDSRVIEGEKQLSFTTKGDLGPMGIYSAVGYSYRNRLDAGNPIFLIGGDYSFQVDYDSKLMVQLEYLRDEADKIQNEIYGQNLVLGSLSYEVDQFSSIGLMGAYNPEDESGVLAPNYTTIIGSGLDFNLTGTIFVGEEDSQFGPKEIPQLGLELPKSRLEAGFSYTF